MIAIGMLPKSIGAKQIAKLPVIAIALSFIKKGIFLKSFLLT
jgi:hypothetical protein